jgi:K+-transporting ATPase KdpF subunit
VVARFKGCRSELHSPSRPFAHRRLKTGGGTINRASGCFQRGSDFRNFALRSIQGRRSFMDYIIAGAASLGLFIYLIYALLRPEKF